MHSLQETSSSPRLCIYNTFSGCKEVFKPLNPECVTIYACGPTVYNVPHIGNARSALVADIVFRTVQTLYPCVHFVRNITDVDDKILQAAEKSGVSPFDLTKKFTSMYHEDTDAIGVLRPTNEPIATEYIPHMISIIQTLIAKGYAYATPCGHVYFDVSAYYGYGALSRRFLDYMDTDNIDTQSRIKHSAYKKNSGDFVVWKPKKVNESISFSSPWGDGRPGWHIECSAIIEQCFGTSIDIHIGGYDLLFPHHENERAQSMCVHDASEECVRYWIHNGLVCLNKEKMSKSMGNVIYLRDLLAQADGMVVRLAMLLTHYRSPIEWGDHLLEQARGILRHFRPIFTENKEDIDNEIVEKNYENNTNSVLHEFFQALYDDFNTSLAIMNLITLIKEKGKKKENFFAVKKGLTILGFIPGLYSMFAPKKDKAFVFFVEENIQKRKIAKEKGDFAKADSIRLKLKDEGVQLKDNKDGGTNWEIELR